MIKNFPEFGILELGDKEEILRLTKDLLHYSDFTFSNLWSRDIAISKREFSKLNGNLIVKMFDYKTNGAFFSVCGLNMPNETISTLTEFIKKEGLNAPIRLIPEEFALKLNLESVTIEEDRNSFDYIYSTDELKSFEGGKFKQKRNEVSGLLKEHPDVEARELDIKDALVKKDISCLFHRWAQNKIEKIEDYESRENDTFNNTLILAETYDLSLLGIYAKGNIVAFIIYEIVNQDYAVGYFAKTCPEVRGVNAYLLQMLSKTLSSKGIKYFNNEDDVGVESLQTAKMRFRPVKFLKKYTIKLI